MLGSIIWLCLYYHGLVWVYTRMKPAYRPVELSRRERSAEVPIKMISIVHAAITSTIALAYCLQWVTVTTLFDCRLFSTAFLLFDFVQAFTFWRKDGEQSILAHPYGVAFHHVLTVFYMYGVMFNSSIAGLLAFFVSEIPVVFLNMTWLYFYMGNSETRSCAITSIVTIVTYFFFRILLFPAVFFIVLLPQISLFHPLTLPLLLLFFIVYCLNCLWFYKLINKTMRLLPALRISYPYNLRSVAGCCATNQTSTENVF